MKKKIHSIKLEILGGGANPGPPIGPALGGKIRKPMDFCRAFNEKTAKKKGELLRVNIQVYDDSTFSFSIKKTPTMVLIKKVLQLEKGSAQPKKNKVATLRKEHIDSIIAKKKDEFNAWSRDAIIRTIAGTARSMGILVDLT